MEAIIYNRSCWIYRIDDIDITVEFSRLLSESDFLVLNSLEYEFSPGGYSKIWLLGESHLSIHTFAEKKVLYLELSSCVERQAELFWNNLEVWANKHSKHVKFMKKQKYRADDY